jgi:ATP-binding cassette subfamily E protein 1
MNVSYKPQTIAPTFEGTVKELLYEKAGQAWLSPNFTSEVSKPLRLDALMDN